MLCDLQAHGFEILCSRYRDVDNASLAETVLEDSSLRWQQFKKSLTSKGYFRVRSCVYYFIFLCHLEWCCCCKLVWALTWLKAYQVSWTICNINLTLISGEASKIFHCLSLFARILIYFWTFILKAYAKRHRKWILDW